MKSGYLYIITNSAFPQFVKVGTTFDITKRIHTYQTGDPFRRYKVRYLLHHPSFREAERKIKEAMKPFALSIKGEWFEIDLEMAKSRLDESLEAYNNGEWSDL
jgi:hypothetical protein